MSINQRRLRYRQSSRDLYSRHSLASMYFNTTFNSFLHRGVYCQETLASFISSDRHSLPISAIPLTHWCALNTPTPSGVPIVETYDYWGQGIKQASWLCLRVLSIAHWTFGSGFRCSQTTWSKSGGALSRINRVCWCWWRGTSSKSNGKWFAKKC
jgi:hypothetical protein